MFLVHFCCGRNKNSGIENVHIRIKAFLKTGMFKNIEFHYNGYHFKAILEVYLKYCFEIITVIMNTILEVLF